MEEWRAVVGYEGLYEVSNAGAVRSLNYNRTGLIQVLRPGVNNCGYRRVTCWSSGNKNRPFVHRLVGIAFLPNPCDLSEIDHINRDKSDNSVGNLRWVTRSENKSNRGLFKTNTSGHQNISRLPDGFEVQIRRNGKRVYRQCFKTLEEAVFHRDAFLATL